MSLKKAFAKLAAFDELLGKPRLSTPMQPTTIEHRKETFKKEKDPIMELPIETAETPIEIVEMPKATTHTKGPDYHASWIEEFVKYAQITGEGEDGKATKKDEGFDLKELEMGIEEEQEHTDELPIAEEIAKDHLEEEDDYYSVLKKCMK